MIQPSLHPILAPVRLVGDHDHVRARAQQRVRRLALQQRELLDRRENDAARLPRRQHLAELLPALRLLGRLLEEVLRRAELLVKLPVEIVAIRHHDQRRVVHLRLLQELARVAAHRDALARALRVPEDARLARAGHDLPAIRRPLLLHPRAFLRRRGNERHPHRLPHAVELMVARDLLDQRVAVLLEEHEIADVIEKQIRPEKAAHHLLQLEFQRRLVVLVRNRPPRHEPLWRRRERADARVHPVAHHQCLVEDEQVRDLLLIGLELLVSLPHIRVRIRRILQLDDPERQAH